MQNLILIFTYNHYVTTAHGYLHKMLLSI